MLSNLSECNNRELWTLVSNSHHRFIKPGRFSYPLLIIRLPLISDFRHPIRRTKTDQVHGLAHALRAAVVVVRLRPLGAAAVRHVGPGHLRVHVHVHAAAHALPAPHQLFHLRPPRRPLPQLQGKLPTLALPRPRLLLPSRTLRLRQNGWLRRQTPAILRLRRMLLRVQRTDPRLQTLTAVPHAQKNTLELLRVQFPPRRILPLQTIQEQREERRIQTQDWVPA